jgi:sulfate adenylyltransferase subunit 1
MIEQVCKEAQSSKQIYSTEERELNAYVRKHFPEWGCIEI